MNVRRLIPGTAVAATATALVALTALTGCGNAGASGDDGKLDVMASFYPLGYLVDEIGGDHVRLTTLTEPGQEPHDLEVSARQRAAMEESDLIVYLKGLQPAVDEAVGQSEARTKVDATTLTSLEKTGAARSEEPADEHPEHTEGPEHGEPGHEHQDGDEAHADEGHTHESGEAHADEGGGEDAHADDHGHDHSHDGPDPHIWLDPVRYSEVAEGVGKALEKADPDHAPDYRNRTDALVKRLDALHTTFRSGLKDTRTEVFITTHSAFGYLADRYGLIEESISGLNPESEPSGARIKELQKVAKADDVNTVFYETLVSDRTAKSLAADTGMRTDVLDPIEGITEKSRGDDYFQVMEANLAALRTALGAK
ncbi:metal ABC transporter solute-binding protein, Zn/Mn family [Streptomyces sp. NPDC005955]|uniref:metal ABC transporter substrate-binding protein n=1 Tax=Streptomyces sp. NPDC005955 TaxID=3364738 RepID=UPI0036C9F07E